MKRKKIIIASVIIVLLIIMVIISTNRNRNHKRTIYADFEIVCFDRDILPVFKRNCGVMGCHDQLSAAGDYVLTDYNSILKGVTPFDPDKSIVYKTIIGEGSSSMPPGIVLPAHEQIIIRNWIDQGAENKGCPTGSTPPENKPRLNVNH